MMLRLRFQSITSVLNKVRVGLDIIGRNGPVEVVIRGIHALVLIIVTIHDEVGSSRLGRAGRVTVAKTLDGCQTMAFANGLFEPFVVKDRLGHCLGKSSAAFGLKGVQSSQGGFIVASTITGLGSNQVHFTNHNGFNLLTGIQNSTAGEFRVTQIFGENSYIIVETIDDIGRIYLSGKVVLTIYCEPAGETEIILVIQIQQLLRREEIRLVEGRNKAC